MSLQLDTHDSRAAEMSFSMSPVNGTVTLLDDAIAFASWSMNITVTVLLIPSYTRGNGVG